MTQSGNSENSENSELYGILYDNNQPRFLYESEGEKKVVVNYVTRNPSGSGFIRLGKYLGPDRVMRKRR